MIKCPGGVCQPGVLFLIAGKGTVSLDGKGLCKDKARPLAPREEVPWRDFNQRPRSGPRLTGCLNKQIPLLVAGEF